MSSTIRRRGPDVPAVVVIGAVVAVNVWAAAVFWWAAGRHVDLALACPAAVTASDVACAWWLRHRSRPRSIDSAARYSAQPLQLPRSTTSGARGIAGRLQVPASASPGLYLGKTVRGGRDLWGTWEDTYVEISGAQAGATDGRAIPNIVAAPGTVVATSCKRDLMDATRGIREQRGRVWVFDPQDVAGERPAWYWNPLDMVAGSMKEALSVAGLITFTQREPHARSDAYFEPAAERLIALLLFSADAAGLPITAIRRWLLRPDDTTPADIMQGAGHALGADAYRTLSGLPSSQRAGIFGTAVQYTSWLTAPEILRWITPGGGREPFPFAEFLEGDRDTMYVLSRDRDKVAAPAVCTLTAALVVAAEYRAARMPGGRLPVPYLVVLDEAASGAPLPFWPNRYSHYGSRGVNVMMLLQSWAQGVGVWGDKGMAKIWGAASVRAYGSGGVESAMLGDMSRLAGTFEAPTTAVTRTRGELLGRVHRGSRREPILHPADIGALPPRRTLVQVSGAVPVLVRNVPWQDGPYAEAIRASLAKYAPRRQR